jgi:hypothetical protein
LQIYNTKLRDPRRRVKRGTYLPASQWPSWTVVGQMVERLKQRSGWMRRSFWRGTATFDLLKLKPESEREE